MVHEPAFRGSHAGLTLECLKSRSSLNELERNSGTVLEIPRNVARRLSGSNMDCASRVCDLAISCCACTRDAWNRDALSLSRRRSASARGCYDLLEEGTFRRASVHFCCVLIFLPPTMDVASLKVFITRNYASLKYLWENISLRWSTREFMGVRFFISPKLFLPPTFAIEELGGKAG